MKPPVYDPAWLPLVKALYAHDMQEMWDPSLATHVYNMYHADLDRYLCLAGGVPLRILDVGCAQGTLALLLAEAGHSVTAVDLRAEFLEYARSRYERGDLCFVEGNALELDLRGPYDLIFANQILEHTVYPLRLIRGMKRLLGPGGLLVITTPNGQYVRSHLPLFRELGDPAGYEDRQFFPDGDGHFFAYSRDEIRGLLAEAGLVNIRVSPFDTPWITGHMKVRHLHGTVPVKLLRFLDQILLGMPVGRWAMAYQLMGCGSKSV